MNAISPRPEAGAAEPALLTREAEGVFTLTLNRPARFNVLSESLLAALEAALDAVAARDDARCVVLAASGRAFCAGHDLSEMRANPDESYYRDLFARCSRVMRAITALPVPVIAQVQGIATAAGCQLVAACDLAVAGRAARFAVSGIDIGLFCATPAVALTRNVPAKVAFDMLFTGRFVAPDEALSIGLVNAVVDDAALPAAVARYAEAIRAKSPAAVRLGKRLFQAQRGLPLADAYRLAGDTMACNMMEADARTGIDAFLNKRKPAG